MPATRRLHTLHVHQHYSLFDCQQMDRCGETASVGGKKKIKKMHKKNRGAEPVSSAIGSRCQKSLYQSEEAPDAVAMHQTIQSNDASPASTNIGQLNAVSPSSANSPIRDTAL